MGSFSRTKLEATHTRRLRCVLDLECIGGVKWVHISQPALAVAGRGVRQSESLVDAVLHSQFADAQRSAMVSHQLDVAPAIAMRALRAPSNPQLERPATPGLQGSASCQTQSTAEG